MIEEDTYILFQYSLEKRKSSIFSFISDGHVIHSFNRIYQALATKTPNAILDNRNTIVNKTGHSHINPYILSNTGNKPTYTYGMPGMKSTMRTRKAG